VATIVNLFNPEAIILSGKVSRAADIFMGDLKASLAEHALPAAFAETKILLENPSKNLSSLGAVAVVLNQIFNSSHITFEEVI
jgi:predicted NBD/HSP70 family sugar kinase